MKNLFSKFIKDERGDVVQYIIVLAVIAVILAFAFPKIKALMSKGVGDTETKVTEAFTDM